MATVTWIGQQIRRRQVDTLTVGSSTAGHTFITTINGKAVSYTAISGDTTATIAAAIRALLAASTEGEFRELQYGTVASSAFTVTGPEDGAPFALAVSGTGTYSRTATTTPLSPHDLNDGKNYSTGALPSGSDHLVFENSSVDAKYNADALAGVGLASVTRRASFTGRLGLLAQNANGYREYRASEVEFDAPLQTYEVAAGDQAGHVRVKSVGASAVTLSVQGDGGQTALGFEVVQVRGLPSSSAVRVNGASLALAAYAGHTATVATLNAENATLWLGAGVTLGTANLTNVTGWTEAGWTALTMYTGGTLDVRGAAAGANSGLKVYGGTVNWRSTGAVGNSPVVGTGGTVSFEQAPASVTCGGTVELNAGAAWLDPSGRIGTPYNVNLNRCTLADVNLNVGPNKTLAVS